MPFRVVNAPYTFRRVMNVVTQRLGFLKVYRTDAVIISRSMEEHKRHIGEVLQGLSDHGLKIRLSVGHFAQSKIPLLGHMTTLNGI